MKKKHFIFLILILIVILIAGYFLFQKNKEKSPQGFLPPAGQELTYKNFISATEPITFSYPQEWVEISPEQIEKAIPEAAKEKTKILFYAASPQNMIIMTSKTNYTTEESGLEQIVEKIIGESRQIDPKLKVEYQDIKEKEAIVEILYNLQGIDWSTKFRCLLSSASEGNILYAIQLTAPKNVRDNNKEVIEKILSSLVLTEI